VVSRSTLERSESSFNEDGHRLRLAQAIRQGLRDAQSPSRAGRSSGGEPWTPSGTGGLNSEAVLCVAKHIAQPHDAEAPSVNGTVLVER
jgi:hypothetical protein